MAERDDNLGIPAANFRRGCKYTINGELHKNGKVWRRESWVWRRNIEKIAKGTTDPRGDTVTTKTT